jgi:hypothetical protein
MGQRTQDRDANGIHATTMKRFPSKQRKKPKQRKTNHMQITINNASITGEGGSITNATITGDATITQPTEPPLVIWGPGDPRPTLPIAGWDPGSGAWPTPPQPQPPLVIWGPGDPRPTLPIAGWDPDHGNWPDAPIDPTDPPMGPVEWKCLWTPETGWVVVGIPTGPTPTPSA